MAYFYVECWPYFLLNLFSIRGKEMEVFYKENRPVLQVGNNYLVSIKNFFYPSNVPLAPEEIRVGTEFNQKYVCENKVFWQDDFFLEFLSFSPDQKFVLTKKGYSLAIITLSDKGYAGLREDLSGPEVENMVAKELSLVWKKRYVLPDNVSSLKYLFIHLVEFLGVDLIITTGGTGVYPRDITADVTLCVVEKRLAGFEQAMLAAGLAKTPHAAISRAVCGLSKKTLILNLPGSVKAVCENLSPVLPALKHCLDKLNGDPTDCQT
ncbi:MAG: MogA/MoaB family molybdenum cofactor biosynthesis protein [Desulfonauticus sp.]|nr:MogA/MoaB family molybdenum cofactor biosynthesis protein [Desulfonauticus sp.]